MELVSQKPRLVTKTLRLRVKDKHATFLREQSRAVNTVWNFCNELSFKHWQRTRKFMSAYDMQTYTSGSGKLLELHSQTVQAIQEEYCSRRKQHGRVKLRWRVSGGSRRSLGWVPIKASAIQYRNGQLRYMGRLISLWDSYGLHQYKLGTGSFSEDARGRWYLNVTVKVEAKPKAPSQDVGQSVGIDLGCKEALVTSEGDRVEGRWYRALEEKLAIAQRAKNKGRVRAIHAKISNRRKDDLHKISRQLVDKYAAIFVGDVSSEKLVKTKMAKSVLDAGWSMLKTMIEYKSDHAGVVFEVVGEFFTTQTCSACNSRTGPKGQEGLGIRAWQCSACDSVHDRDVNAAKNILALGHQRLAGGIPVL